VKAVRELFAGKRVVVVFPPARVSKQLMKTADAYLHAGRASLARSVFPDTVVKADGYVLRRPQEWR
jgi:hypothetical protein